MLTCLFSVGQEIVLRLCFPVPEVENFNRVNYSYLITKDPASKVPLRNASYRFTSGPDGFDFTHTLNIYGFRDADWQVETNPDRPRVMFIGDSYVEGAGAADGETIVDGFRSAARESGLNLEAMNLGIQGIGPPEYLRLIADAGRLFRPRHIVVTLMANDFANLQPMNPDLLWGHMTQPFINQQWEPRIKYLIGHLKTYGNVTTAWTTAPFPFFGAVPDPRNPWSEEKGRRSMESFVAPEIAAAMRAGKLNPYLARSHPAEHYWYPRSAPIGPYLAILKDYLADLNCQLIVVYFPAPEQVSDAYLSHRAKYNPPPMESLMGPVFQRPARDAATHCSSLLIPFLDLTPHLRQLEADGRRSYWLYDNHPRGSTYLDAGRLIFDRFKSELTPKSE